MTWSGGRGGRQGPGGGACLPVLKPASLPQALQAGGEGVPFGVTGQPDRLSDSRDLSFKNHQEFHDGDSRTLNQVSPTPCNCTSHTPLTPALAAGFRGCPLAFPRSIFPNAFLFFHFLRPSSSLDSFFAHFVTNKWIWSKLTGGPFTVPTSPSA